MRLILSLGLMVAAYNPAYAQVRCEKTFLLTQKEYKENKMLEERYGVRAQDLERTQKHKIPVILKMADHETLSPKITGPIVRELKTYDAVIVGGGPAGLTSALYLAEAGKSVLVLERNHKMGGLAFGNELKGVRAGGGAAYSAGPDGKFELDMFKKIGLRNYKKKLTIEEPIDSYLWKGKLYKGIWEEHTLVHLPKSFALFKHALMMLVKKGASQESGEMATWADSMTMKQLVEQMPKIVETWTDSTSKHLVKEFKKDENVPAENPMNDVLDLLDLYGRSALGGTTKDISARQFLDFYESEIYTRYTGTLGTGDIAAALLKKLAKFPNVELRTNAPVASLENTQSGVKTFFIENGIAKEVNAKHAIFAAAVKLAPKLIKELNEKDPEKAQVISQMEMTDYAVHVARLKGHPYRATYDTWSHSNGDLTKPTDFILGRWQDPKIKAYEGTREFQKDLVDDYGIISIYQPLGLSNKNHFGKEANLRLVDGAVQDMLQKLKNEVDKNGKKIEVELVESYRWPDSIHIVRPGSLLRTPILARPLGNIRFANNTVAAPELETAMARAAREALLIIEAGNQQMLPAAGE